MMSPADPIHCGIVDTGVSCRPSTWCRSGHICVSWKVYTLWHRGQWCLLQTLYIVTWATMMSHADPIHCGIRDNDISCRTSTWCQWTMCLLESLYIVAQGTMTSPADPTHCGMGDNDVSCRPYTFGHSGHWSLLQTLCITPHYFDTYSCCCQISAHYKRQGRVSAAVFGNCNTHQHFRQFTTVPQASWNGGLRHTT